MPDKTDKFIEAVEPIEFQIDDMKSIIDEAMSLVGDQEEKLSDDEIAEHFQEVIREAKRTFTVLKAFLTLHRK